MSEREIQSMLAFFHLYDIDCFLRPSTTQRNSLYRYLEDGASGLMIPHISNAEQASAIVRATKFPPLGDRGLDGAGLDCNFQLDDMVSYTDDANRETFIIVQIETLEAIENVEAIASVEGVDGLFIGPGDLGLRIKKLNGSFTLDDARKRVAAACQKFNKSWGLPATSESQLKQFHQEGARIVPWGSDFGASMNMLLDAGNQLDRVHGSRQP